MTKFFIDQHGCAKNQVDGELVMARLLSLGYEQTFTPALADVIIVNSCGFIASAKKESLDAVYAAKRAYPDAKVVLAGCLAERYAETFRTALPEADAVFGNGDLSRSGDVVGNVLSGERTILVPEQKGICSGERTHFLSYRGAAYVKLTEGCSNRCTFCAIPLIRGAVRSRPEDDVIAEIQSLVARGVFEINLIGQDVAAYGTGIGDDVAGHGRAPLPAFSADGKNTGTQTQSALAHLLGRIACLSGDFRVRLLYIHPDHFNRDILPVIKDEPRIVPYFDIPFQSGADTVIRAMNRIGPAQEYIRLISDIRAALPDAVIRTTFLTGFPGETDSHAAETERFLAAIQSDWSGCFTYSREEDTPAYALKKRVPHKIAAARAATLQSIQADITAHRLAARIGAEYDVLVEEVSAGNDAESFAIARAWFQSPEVDGNVVVRYAADDTEARRALRAGRVVHVRVDAVTGVDLDAHFVCDSALHPRGERPDVSPLFFAPEASA